MSVTSETEHLFRYYADLLIYQYASRWRAYNTVYSLIEPALMSQGFETVVTSNEDDPVLDNEGNYTYVGSILGPILPLALQGAFNFPGAVGVQLDTLAKYFGGQRTNLLLNGESYTFDDAEFTTYLQLLALRNNLPSDLGTVESFLYDYFTVGATQILSVYDFADMHLSFVYAALLGTYPIFEVFIATKNLPKPMGVGAGMIYNPTGKSFFAYRTYKQTSQPGTSGFNFYAESQTGTFLQYSYGLVVSI